MLADMTSTMAIVSSFAVGFTAVYLFKFNTRTAFAMANAISGASGKMKMVFVVRTDLKMGKGKAAAQCAHAAVSCYKTALFSAEKELQQWEKEGQTKEVFATKEEKGLMTLAKQAQNVGLVAVVIHDAGHTQLRSGTATVLGIGPGPQDLITTIVGHLKHF